jgi:hypothetical protein
MPDTKGHRSLLKTRKVKHDCSHASQNKMRYTRTLDLFEYSTLLCFLMKKGQVLLSQMSHPLFLHELESTIDFLVFPRITK